MSTDTTALEKQSLEAHVDLCALRYHQLETRLVTLEVKMDLLQKDLTDGQKSLKSVIITTVSSLIASVLAVGVAIIFKL